jgi:hypothetical protein
MDVIFNAMLPFAAIFAFTKCFSLLDKAISAYGFVKPYYAVHVIHNTMMVALTAGDVYRSINDFNNSLYHPTTWLATYLCFALHFYHIIDYRNFFHRDDWLHHGLMIGVALPLGCLSTSGSLMGMNLFFTTGLPGGISYALLFAERNGWITREQEKKINVPIHVWIRAPGCTANATLITTAMLSAPYVSTAQAAIALLIAGLTYWNGQYFMQQVVAAASRSHLPSSTREVSQVNENNMVPHCDTDNEVHEQ